MIKLILIGLISFIILWVFFVNVMTWKKHENKIPKYVKPLLYFIAAIGYIWDVLFNITFGSIMFLELPQELTLSERIRRLLLTDRGWRFAMGYWICKHLIEPWDQGHCGLGFKE